METKLLTRVRFWLIFFIFALALSGLTAIPLKLGVNILDFIFFNHASPLPNLFPQSFTTWIAFMVHGLQETLTDYPFIAYGTDWLAFGHISIAVIFIAVVKEPVSRKWLLDYGLVICAMLIPWALVFGTIRGIPLIWRLIDCSFGVFGAVPLLLAKKHIHKLIGFSTTSLPQLKSKINHG